MEVRAQTHPPVILVVDDEVVARNMVANILHRSGYLILAAANGREALELSRTYPNQIDLLIADSSMPEMGGVELCEHFLQERPKTRVLLLGAGAAEEAVAAEKKWSFLTKPLDYALLRAEVERILQ